MSSFRTKLRVNRDLRIEMWTPTKFTKEFVPSKCSLSVPMVSKTNCGWDRQPFNDLSMIIFCCKKLFVWTRIRSNLLINHLRLEDNKTIQPRYHQGIEFHDEDKSNTGTVIDTLLKSQHLIWPILRSFGNFKQASFGRGNNILQQSEMDHKRMCTSKLQRKFEHANQ